MMPDPHKRHSSVEIEALRSLFPAMRPADAELILEASVPVDLAKGQTILQQGFRSPSVYLVLSGEIEVYKKSRSRTLVIRSFRSGSVLGEIAAALEIPSSVSGRATSEAKVLAVERERFLVILYSSPSLMQFLLIDAYRELLRADRQRITLCSASVAERVLQVLVEQRPTAEAKIDGEFKALPPHAALARAVGTSREVVTRAIKALVIQGRIQVTGRTFRVL